MSTNTDDIDDTSATSNSDVEYQNTTPDGSYKHETFSDTDDDVVNIYTREQTARFVSRTATRDTHTKEPSIRTKRRANS